MTPAYYTAIVCGKKGSGRPVEETKSFVPYEVPLCPADRTRRSFSPIRKKEKNFKLKKKNRNETGKKEKYGKCWVGRARRIKEWHPKPAFLRSLSD